MTGGYRCPRAVHRSRKKSHGLRTLSGDSRRPAAGKRDRHKRRWPERPQGYFHRGSTLAKTDSPSMTTSPSFTKGSVPEGKTKPTWLPILINPMVSPAATC